VTHAVRQWFSVCGWFVVAAYFLAIVLINWDICTNMYDPEGPWPGWWPLIWGDLIYGGVGIGLTIVVRWWWRRAIGKPGLRTRV
jgi:hypothetical protein